MTNLVLSTMHSNGLIWAIQVNSNKIKWFFSLFNDKQKFSISIHSFIRKKNGQHNVEVICLNLASTPIFQSLHIKYGTRHLFLYCVAQVLEIAHCDWAHVISYRRFIQIKKKSFTVCSWNIENSFWTDKTN